MQIEIASVNLPRLPLMSFASQRDDQRANVPDVRATGDAIYTTSGRAAIALGLEALGVGQGDRVLVPTYHCPTMVAPVVRAGAQPVFFPITDEGLPDLRWLQAQTTSAKAILVPHYFGIPHDLQHVRAFCDDRGIFLIEDCAHAFFGIAGDRCVGAWGDVTTASLTKFFPGPDGGLLIVRTPAAGRVNVRPPAMISEARSWLDTLEMSTRYRRLGAFNSLLSVLFGLKTAVRRPRPAPPTKDAANIEASVSDCLDERQLPLRASAASRWLIRTSTLQRVIDRRQENYRMLVELMSGLAGVRAVMPRLPETAVPYVVPLMVDRAGPVYSRLRSAGVPVFRWDELWPGTPLTEDDAATSWSTSLLQVACHQDLAEGDIRLVADQISAAVSRPANGPVPHPSAQ